MKILNYKPITFLVLLLLGSATVFAQTRKTATEKVDKWKPWALRDITRNVTYTYSYIEVDGEKVYDGPFTFEARGINNANVYEKVTGSYSKGKREGIWKWTVSIKDIYSPDYNADGSYLTVNGTMITRYKNGLADGEWSCSYVEKRRDKVYNRAQKKSVFGEYINNDEKNFSQKVIFKNDTIVEFNGIKFPYGVEYNPNVSIDGEQKKISLEEYEQYVKEWKESKTSIWRKNWYGMCYTDHACYQFAVGQFAYIPLEQSHGGLFNPSYFSPLYDYEIGSFEYKNGIVEITHYEKFDTVEINNYLKTHSAEEFWKEYMNRVYHPEQHEQIEKFYKAKQEEEYLKKRLRYQINDSINRYERVLYEVNRTHIQLILPKWYGGGTCYEQGDWKRYEYKNIDFLTPKIPSDWQIKKIERRFDVDVYIENIGIYNHLLSLYDTLKGAKSLDDVNICVAKINTLRQEYESFVQSIQNINNAVPKEMYVIEATYLLEIRSMTRELEKKYQSGWTNIAKELMRDKPQTNVYTVIYYTFQYIHDNLQPSKYSTITDYWVDYYNKMQQLISYVNEHPRKASKKKTELELLEAAGIVL